MSYEKLYQKILPYKLELLKELEISEDIFFEMKIKIMDFYAYNINILNPNKPSLVFIHGYGSCSYLNFNLFKYLKNDFNIYAWDVVGHGLSTFTIDPKKKKIYNSTESCLNYFLQFIHDWLKIIELKEFYIMGHSFGGYLVSHFVNKYKTIFKIKDIFLISPGGFNKASNIKYDNLKNICGERYKFTEKIITKLADIVFEKKISPYKFFIQPIKFFFLKSAVKKFKLNKNLNRIIYEIWNILISSLNKDAEVIFYIFHYGTRSKKPISEIYKELLENYKIYFYYGDNDYMDHRDTINYCKSNNLKINFKFIKNACHDIPTTNPNLLYKEIIDNLNNK